ncbi:MAG TPA: anti-sigma factor [Pyrinomonadaceae bacterium]|nr:anti-sigma factor [Pyrinomonadaceae bacterium]
MPDETHVFDLLPVYALGSLDADEADQVEEHLLSCWICRSESHAFQTIAEQLSLALPPVTPPADLRERLMQRIQVAHAPQRIPDHAVRRPLLDRLLPVWGLASLACIIFLGAFSLALWQRVNHLEFVTSPGGMRAIPLSGTNEVPDATGFVIVGADGRNGALVVDALPPLGEDRQYQLWLIRDGERTSGAVFSTDEQSYGGTRIKAPNSLLEYSAIEITIEPADGSPHPTGMVVLDGLLFNP